MSRQRPLFVYTFYAATTAEWASRNPRLLNGIPYYDTDLRLVKIGDGITHYNDAPYAFLGGTGATGPAGPPGPPGPPAEPSEESPAMIQTTYTASPFYIAADEAIHPVTHLYFFLKPNAQYLVTISGQIECTANADATHLVPSIQLPGDATESPRNSENIDADANILASLDLAANRQNYTPFPDAPYSFSYVAVITSGEAPGVGIFSLGSTATDPAMGPSVSAGARLTAETLS